MGIEAETVLSVLVRHPVDEMVHVRRVRFPGWGTQTYKVIVFHHLIGGFFQFYNGDVRACFSQAFFNMSGDQQRVAGLGVIDDQDFHGYAPFLWIFSFIME